MKKSDGFFFLIIIITGLNENITYASDLKSSNGYEEFDPSFLSMGNAKGIDLSRFSYGSAITPGVYKTQIYLNDQIVAMQAISFKENANKSVTPCLTTSLLERIQIDLPDAAKSNINSECVDISKFMPGSKVDVDSNEQTLKISIPQVFVKHEAQGTVPPSLWDGGVPAILLGYNLNAYSSDNYKSNYNSIYSGINAGINLKDWYFRHNGTWSWDKLSGERYQSINTYVQHDIANLKSHLVGGRTNTTGMLFDTLPFTGISLRSDERMEPLSRRGYAPEIRGIAKSNAKVTIYQNGITLYEKNVSPGEFIINDLYPTGYGGDLDVEIREADGSTQRFKVPFSSVTQLLRPGQSRYELTGGKLYSSSINKRPVLLQGTWRYGINNKVTFLSGLQGNKDYKAALLGSAFSTPIGALSFDITHSEADLGSQNKKNYEGESYRVSYNKNITETQSNIALAAYRFSTSHYLDYMSAMQIDDVLSKGLDEGKILRVKNRITLTANQGLFEGWGQLFVSASLQNYWNVNGTVKQYQIGYNNIYDRLTYGINAGRSVNQYGKVQDSIMLTFSFPLSNKYNAPTGRVSYTNNSDGLNTTLASLSGNTGVDNEFSYGLSANTTNKGTGESMSANGQYRSPLTSVTAGVSAGKHYTSISGGLSGTLIGHAGGLTLSPYQSDTFALIEAKGAEGAKVSGYQGVYIDRLGWAAVPYLNPYQMNDIGIDLNGTDLGVELDNTLQKVSPKDLAVVKLDYKSQKGKPLLISSLYNGEKIPFGAEVLDQTGNIVGYAGQGGQIYSRVNENSGTLTVKWGDTVSKTCKIKYEITDAESTKLTEINKECSN